MKLKSVRWLVLALILAAFMATAAGCRHPRLHGGSHEDMMAAASREVDGVLDDIEATDEQKKTVFTTMDAVHAGFKAFHEKCQEAHTVLLAQWRSEQPDAKLIDSLVDNRIEDFRALAHDVVDSVLGLHSEFTPEQRNELADMAEKHLADR